MCQLSATITDIYHVLLEVAIEAPGAPGTGDLAITMQWSVLPIGERPHQPISFRFPQRD